MSVDMLVDSALTIMLGRLFHATIILLQKKYCNACVNCNLTLTVVCRYVFTFPRGQLSEFTTSGNEMSHFQWATGHYASELSLL